MVARGDITRMGGRHWNLNRYWRGRVQSTATPSRSSIQDLINRTCQMSFNYVNPRRIDPPVYAASTSPEPADYSLKNC